MERTTIAALNDRWEELIEDVLSFREVALAKLQATFADTYAVLKVIAPQSLMPKQVGELLIVMHDFGWWVGDLEETPLHARYQEVIGLVQAMERSFFVGRFDADEMENAIAAIGDASEEA